MQRIKAISCLDQEMSDPIPAAPMAGFSVCTKEDEDYAVGVVQDIENETGNLVIRGSLDQRTYLVPQSTIVSIDQNADKIVLDMTQDDFIEYEKTG